MNITLMGGQVVPVKQQIGSVAIHRVAWGADESCPLSSKHWQLTHVPSGFKLPIYYSRYILNTIQDARIMAQWWDAHLLASGEFGVSPITTPDQGHALADALIRFVRANNINPASS